MIFFSAALRPAHAHAFIHTENKFQDKGGAQSMYVIHVMSCYGTLLTYFFPFPDCHKKVSTLQQITSYHICMSSYRITRIFHFAFVMHLWVMFYPIFSFFSTEIVLPLFIYHFLFPLYAQSRIYSAVCLCLCFCASFPPFYEQTTLGEGGCNM